MVEGYGGGYNMNNRAEVMRGHSRIHEAAAALFRALDAADIQIVPARFETFIDRVEAHLRLDATAGYRLLVRHSSEAVRRVAERVLTDQETVVIAFEKFVHDWRGAAANDLLRSSFREDLETLVSSLLQRIRAEIRLNELISGVA